MHYINNSTFKKKIFLSESGSIVIAKSNTTFPPKYNACFMRKKYYNLERKRKKRMKY